jgi:hypothetical protein
MVRGLPAYLRKPSQTAIAQGARPTIVHDSECYILEAQHGESWAAEDRNLDAKRAELRN